MQQIFDACRGANDEIRIRSPYFLNRIPAGAITGIFSKGESSPGYARQRTDALPRQRDVVDEAGLADADGEGGEGRAVEGVKLREGLRVGNADVVDLG